MDAKNKKGLIVAGVVLAIVGGAIWYFKKKKKDAESLPTTDTATTSTDTASASPSSATQTKSAESKPKPSIMPMKVLIPKAGTAVYSSDGKKIVRKTTTANEEVGGFAGYRTINNKVFVLFPDKYNQNKPTIVLKSEAKLK
jgi:LPXTG-motif cell wall-anchored protein